MAINAPCDPLLELYNTELSSLKVLAEVASQERNLEALRVAIADKEGPLKVAQARLTARSLRPNVELCHDSAQSQLLTEVQGLTDQISR